MPTIVQVVPSLLYGDAVGNDILALHRALLEEGFDARIAAQCVDDKRIKIPNIMSLDDLNQLSTEDTVMYHMATAHDFVYKFAHGCYKKILVYHNITPPHFYKNYFLRGAHACREGLEQTRYLKDFVDIAIADSEQNKHDLLDMGYTCPIEVIPVFVPFEDYETSPDKKVISKYVNLPGTNILFTGRVVPNKCHHDIIKTFAAYKRQYDAEARLFLVGSFLSLDPYCAQLLGYIEKLGLEDSVIFPGHIRFDEILAYYSIADIFLCQSEHEGFCVPLLEAMVFDVPVVAYDSTAIPWTLGYTINEEGKKVGGAGVLLDTKDPYLTASVINHIVVNPDVAESILTGQRKRLEFFGSSRIKEMHLECINTFLKG